MKTCYVDGPPANPTSLGEVWIGNTRPVVEQPNSAPSAHDLDEWRRLQSMEARLIAWAAQLEASRDRLGDVGQFIGAELRRRMAGD
jgi:hypothetical protein